MINIKNDTYIHCSCPIKKKKIQIPHNHTNIGVNKKLKQTLVIDSRRRKFVQKNSSHFWITAAKCE